MSFPLCFDDDIPYTPSDTALVTDTVPARVQAGIYVAGAGDIVVENVSGRTKTYTMTAGGQLYARVRRILATGTTATGISLFVRGM